MNLFKSFYHAKPNPFKVFFGGSGVVGTYEITQDLTYKHLVHLARHIRSRLLEDQVLRRPLLKLFESVYNDNSEFPQNDAELLVCTPIVDQIPNKSKIRAIRNRPPSDNDVVEFLTTSFPDIYLELKSLKCNNNNVVWGVTVTGRDAADRREIAINNHLIEMWHTSIKNLTTGVSAVQMSFMVMGVLLHELAHSSLVWYRKGACNTPKLSGDIEGEAGLFYEKAIFGGVSSCEMDSATMQIMHVGIYKGEAFYPLDEDLATEFSRLDTSKGLPLSNNFNLSAAPPPTIGRFRAKIGRIKTLLSTNLNETSMKSVSSAKHFYTILKDDKRHVMPRGGV